MIAGTERFIATAIWFVRIEPDAPTSMPATISAVLSRAIPVAAADSPVNALSSEITTGMGGAADRQPDEVPQPRRRHQDPEDKERLGVHAGGQSHRRAR